MCNFVTCKCECCRRWRRLVKGMLEEEQEETAGNEWLRRVIGHERVLTEGEKRRMQTQTYTQIDLDLTY